MTEYMIIASALILAIFGFVYGSIFWGDLNMKTVLEIRTYQMIDTLQKPTP